MRRWPLSLAGLTARPLPSGLTLAGLCILILLALASATGLRVNTSRSIPLGLYRVSAGAVGLGAYVMFCPPPSALFLEARRRGYLAPGPCPGGYGYLMKRVSAVARDVVTLADDGMRVNGEPLPHSAPRHADPAGRLLPRFPLARYTLAPAELLLMADGSDSSFDARYFGPIDQAQIRAVIEPVWTW